MPDEQNLAFEQSPPPAFPPELDPYLSPSAPEDPLVASLTSLCEAQYAVLLAYLAYGDQLRCPERDGLYEHFQVHADEVRKALYRCHRRLASMGEEHQASGVTVPPAPRAAPRPVLEALKSLEEQVLQGWTGLNSALDPNHPDYFGFSGFAQDGAQETLARLEDLRRYLGGTP